MLQSQIQIEFNPRTGFLKVVSKTLTDGESTKQEHSVSDALLNKITAEQLKRICNEIEGVKAFNLTTPSVNISAVIDGRQVYLDEE